MMTKMSPMISGNETPEQLILRLQLPIKNIPLLRRALTHRSYLNENPDHVEDNERLEFLGDAVLDFLVGEWLYIHFPEFREGDLTRLRSALVRTEQLGEFASQIQLGDALFLGHGESESGGRSRLALLCAAFEALIGALYLDCGMSIVKAFMEPRLQDAANNILKTNRERDPKSVFQEWVQGKGLGPPIYLTINESGPEHAKVFEVSVLVSETEYGRGVGRSKQAAEKEAARKALQDKEYV